MNCLIVFYNLKNKDVNIFYRIIRIVPGTEKIRLRTHMALQCIKVRGVSEEGEARLPRQVGATAGRPHLAGVVECAQLVSV